MSTPRPLVALAVAVAILGLYPSSLRWSVVQTATALLCLLAAWFVTHGPPVAAKLGRSPRQVARALWKRIEAAPNARFALALSLVHLAMTSVFSFTVLGGVPHVEDEVAQLFHAGLLLETGTVRAPAPPLARDFFEMSMTLMEPHWYSQYPPLHVVLLALGRALGAAWLVNPVLAALTAAALFYATLEMFDATVARVAGLVYLAAPAVLVMSASFMNHVPALFFTSVFVLFFARTWNGGRTIDGLLAGLAIGALFTGRPLTAVGLGVPFIAVAALQVFSPRRRLAFLSMAAGGLVGVAALLWWNQATNDSPLTMGYTVRGGSLHALGFGPRLRGEFTVVQGLESAATNLQRINFALLYWPVPLLGFVAMAMTSRRNVFFAKLLAVSTLTLVALYGAYFSNLWIYGPRNVYSGLAALLPLTALGLVELFRRVETLEEQRRSTAYALALPVLGLCLASAALQTVENARDLQGYRGTTRSLSRAAVDAHLENAVLFVPHENYESFAWRNHALLDGSVVYARNRGALNAELMARLPGRTAYLLCGGDIEPWTEQLETMPAHCPREREVGDSKAYDRLDRAKRRARATGTFTEASPAAGKVAPELEGD